MNKLINNMILSVIEKIKIEAIKFKCAIVFIFFVKVIGVGFFCV